MMKKKQNSIIALCILVGLCAMMLTCCGFGKKPVESTDGTEPTREAKPMSYMVEILSQTNVPVAGVGVYVYADDTRQELVWFAKTDEAGQMSFMGMEGDSYLAVLDGIPEGYEAEESYILSQELSQIRLTGGLAELDDLEKARYKLGDKIHDFTVTDVNGTEYKISELLKKKKAVILNFWYLQCEPCKAEFPYLQEAYEQYNPTVEVLAMNPVNPETDQIADFAEDLGLTFPMAAVENGWEKAMQLTAYPTTVVIDRTGTIALVHKGTIPDTQTFINIFDFFSAEDYEPVLVKKVEDLPMVEDTIGTKDNPYEFGGVTTFEVQVRPGKAVYVNIFKANNLYMQISDPDAYVIYNNEIYYPSNGKVGLVIKCPDTFTPVSLQIGNSGKEKKTFTANLGQFPGTLNNPFDLELGEFATKTNPGNDQGVYYIYTAPADGVMTMTCTSATSGVDFDFVLYNLDSYAFRNKGEDGKTDDQGRYFLQMQARKGDKIQFSVGTLPDSANNYPGGTFGFLAEYEEGATLGDQNKNKEIQYSLTVTDQNRKPMAGVFFSILIDGKINTFATNEKGVAAIKLPEGMYEATVVVPEGYTCSNSKFVLTKHMPTFTVKLEEYVLVTHEYTIQIIDEEALPVPGALVSVGSSFAYTDDKGNAHFTLEENEYTVLVVPPAGYISEQSGYVIEKGQTELTVVLAKGTEEPPEEEKPVDYTVRVKDIGGGEASGVVVQFLDGETPVAMQPADANGQVKVQLKAGTYTVKLVFSGEAKLYETNLTVSADDPEQEVQLYAPFDGEMMELYTGDAMILPEGSTFITVEQTDIITYMIFQPEVSGLYRISVNDPDMVLSYQGGNTSFIQDLTGTTDYKDNTFTRNIKESNLGMIVILGITGERDCVVEINRIGDAILDETDIPAEIYEAKTPPKAFTMPGQGSKTQKYVDLSAGDVKVVYSAKDQKYHLGSENGPVLYMNLGESAPYISMYKMLGFDTFGGTGLNCTFYDEEGTFVRKESYTECMCSYVEKRDEKTGLYPLTEDLIYMVQNGGGFRGWWDAENPSYLFGEVANFNPANGWLYAVCYYE